MKDLKDCSREDLIRIIATIKDGIELLNRIGSQAIKECDTIGWKIEEKPKLEWQENLPEKPMTWHEAVEYAKSLGDGWRLPTKEELEKAYVGKVEGFKSDGYWSLSVAHLDTLNAWYVDFSDGVGHYYYKAGGVFVRCIREVK